MNKLKKFIIENKVIIVLGIILLICLVVIAVISVKSFYSSCDDNYCNRRVAQLREDIKDEIKNKLAENENVVNTSILVKNAIVYISVTFKDDVSIEDAKKGMNVIAPLFSDEELLIYDLDLTIKTEDTEKGFILKGARTTNGNGNIVWSNYNNPKESSE